MECDKIYTRIEDMTPDGALKIFMQRDGDIIVHIRSKNMFGKYADADVEFCSHSGGGRSEHTRKALRLLAEAIEKDNRENPINR